MLNLYYPLLILLNRATVRSLSHGDLPAGDGGEKKNSMRSKRLRNRRSGSSTLVSSVGTDVVVAESAASVRARRVRLLADVCGSGCGPVDSPIKFWDISGNGALNDGAPEKGALIR